MTKIDDKRYYELRKEVRKLYNNDANLEGDLCCSILQIRDKYSFVEGINVSIQDYTITVNMDPQTEGNKVEEILNEIVYKLRAFIRDNINVLNITDKNEFELFLTRDSFCDFIIVGTSIKINL